MSGSMIAARQVPDLLRLIALEPPGWTRLEPQSLTGDPTPGLEARVHDPLWLLARQWQFGEFIGEDAGTPLSVEVRVAASRIAGWQPGDLDPGAAPRPLPAEAPLDPFVEAEPAAPQGPGLRQRAEAGALLAAALEEAGLADARAALLAACPLNPAEPPPPGTPPESWVVPRLYATLARSCPDGALAAAALETGGEAGPPWLAGAPEAAQAAARGWLAWWRGVAPPQAEAAESWLPQRLEHRFSVALGSGEVLRAPLHDGGAIDWYSFDHAAGTQFQVPAEPAAERSFTVLATPLRYAGMPADRLWQFEDGAVNLGALEVQPNDLARLCFVEFGMIYGCDWFTVPVDADLGCLTRIEELAYVTTFGERRIVQPGAEGPPGARFRMFALDGEGGGATLRGLLVPPAARGLLEGRALEEVLLLRDEAANMAWAVERAVQDPGGDPRQRGDEARPAPPPGEPRAGAELRYRLQNTVPRHWIPLVPVPKGGAGGFVLRKGTMTDRDESLGRLLDPTPFTLQEEEVPREGVRLARIPSLARGWDGRLLRWTARRVGIGRGEGASGLVSDSALP